MKHLLTYFLYEHTWDPQLSSLVHSSFSLHAYQMNTIWCNKFSMCFILVQTLHQTTIMNFHQHKKQFLPKTFSQTKHLGTCSQHRFLFGNGKNGNWIWMPYLNILTWGLGETNITLVFMSISTLKGVGSWTCARSCWSSPCLLKFASSILWKIQNIRLNEVFYKKI